MRFVRMALVASLVVNVALCVAITVFVWQRGGFSRFAAQLGWMSADNETRERHELAELSRLTADASDECLFVGDSIFASVPWAEMYSEFRNRSVPGATSRSVAERAEELARMRPARVIICVGINDLAGGTAVSDITRNVAATIAEIRSERPDSEFVICGLIGINPGLSPQAARRTLGGVKAVDAGLRQLAEDEGCQFVELRSEFADKSGLLFSKWSMDGIHLNAAGRVKLAQILEPYSGR